MLGVTSIKSAPLAGSGVCDGGVLCTCTEWPAKVGMAVLVWCTSECRDREAGTGWHTRSSWRPSARETTFDFTHSYVHYAHHRLAHEQLLEAIREKDDYKLILAGQVRASGTGPRMNPQLAALAFAWQLGACGRAWQLPRR